MRRVNTVGSTWRWVVWGLSMLAGTAAAWNPERLTAPIVVDGVTIPYAEFAVFVLPGAPLEIEVDGEATVSFMGRRGHAGHDRWAAPGVPGLETLRVEIGSSGEVAIVHVFTMVPFDDLSREGRLNGYRIGHYPEEPLRNLAVYLPPAGFVEVTAENADTQLSPNFRLRQFVSKQKSGYPKYVVLREELLLKLESILATLNREAFPVSGFVIMSGYRTPYYNAAIGNVRYSRHQWGGAADIYIDEEPADGQMDDVNRDGRIDRKDADWLVRFIDGMSQRGAFGPRVGGLAVYGSTPAHGPFVHVDVRGNRARW